MKQKSLTTRLFGLCYLAMALLWLLRCVLAGGVMLYHKAAGNMPMQTLTAQDLSFASFVPYTKLEWDTPPDDDPNWYLSTDEDPQIVWHGSGYIESVTLNAKHYLPGGSVVLYYLLPGQTDFSEAQKVYADCAASGVYTFALGGKNVVGLRIDPDNVGGVPTLFTGIELNPAQPWYLRFVPGGGSWVLLLGLPALAAALLRLLIDRFAPMPEQEETGAP